MSKMTTDSEEQALQIILTMDNYHSWLSYQQRILGKNLFWMQANALKNNMMRYMYPVVTAAEQAPLNHVQLNKLRLTSEEDRNNGRDQKLVDNEPRGFSTFLDSTSVESQKNNQSAIGNGCVPRRKRNSGNI